MSRRVSAAGHRRRPAGVVAAGCQAL